MRTLMMVLMYVDDPADADDWEVSMEQFDVCDQYDEAFILHTGFAVAQ